MLTKLKRPLIIGVFSLIISGQAFAHAHLVLATPAANSTVAGSPVELDISLKFSEPISLKFSGVKVVGPDNAAIAIGAASQAKGDDSTLLVPISTTLATGVYTVNWHILSKDGHKTHGSYTFTVKP